MSDDDKEAQEIFRRLASGPLEQRHRAFQVLVDAGLVAVHPDPATGGASIEFLQPDHPFVKIFDETKCQEAREREALAQLRWQHIKDRAAKEGVAFNLKQEFFEDAMHQGFKAETIFPDKTPEDKAQWESTVKAWKQPS